MEPGPFDGSVTFDDSTGCRPIRELHSKPVHISFVHATPPQVNVVGLEALNEADASDTDASDSEASEVAGAGPSLSSQPRSSLVVGMLRGEAVESILMQLAGSPAVKTVATPRGSPGPGRSKASDVTSAVSASGGEFFINRALQFFVLHFVMLYALQITGQITVLVLDVLDLLRAIDLKDVAEAYLLSADVMVTALLVVEIVAQVAVARGFRRYLCGGRRNRCGRAFDVVIALVSIALIIFEVTRPTAEAILEEGASDRADEGKGLVLTFESVRNALRTIRVYVFVHRLYGLLWSPLDHLAVLVDDVSRKDVDLV